MAISSVISKPTSCTFHDPITKLPSTRPCLGSASNFLFPCHNYGCHYLTRVTPNRRKKGMAINCNIGPIPSPSPPPAASGPWKGWLVGIVLTVVLPFLKMGKWGPLLFYKNKVDVALQKVEYTVELLEKAAERVDNEAEELYEKLPEGKFKNAVGIIERAAQEAARDAHLVDAAIDKVQELEDKVEKYVESSFSTARKTSKEANTNSVQS